MKKTSVKSRTSLNGVKQPIGEEKKPAVNHLSRGKSREKITTDKIPDKTGSSSKLNKDVSFVRRSVSVKPPSKNSISTASSRQATQQSGHVKSSSISKTSNTSSPYISKSKPPQQSVVTSHSRRERTRPTERKLVKPPRSRSRTLSPSEVKILKNPNVTIPNEPILVSPPSLPTPPSPPPPPKPPAIEDTNITISIPETSSELNSSPLEVCNVINNKNIEEEEVEYDDDFESYESDFESSEKSSSTSEATSSSCSSCSDDEIQTERPKVDEEKKLDSGNYDLPLKYNPASLVGIKEAIERENTHASLSDEGFDEKSILSVNFINFETARRQERQLMLSQKMRHRADDILNMITLDVMSANLLEMIPIPYEIYMMQFGRNGTQQTYCQTNDDAISEEIQTDSIEFETKWCQHPPDYTKPFTNLNDILECKRDLLGVGSDFVSDVDDNSLLAHNPHKLRMFLEQSTQVMLKLIGNRKSPRSNNKTHLPFSSGYQRLPTEQIPFLKDRPVSFIEHAHPYILTNYNSKQDDDVLLHRPIICLWHLTDLTQPNQIFIASDRLTCACSNRRLVFAGGTNGIISVWEMKDLPAAQKTVQDDLNNSWVVNFASFITTPNLSSDCADEIVNIQPADGEEINQIISLSKVGKLIIWSIVSSTGLITVHGPVHDQGLAYWGSVRLVPTVSINLNNIAPTLKDLQCLQFIIDTKDPHHLYIATNYGYVIHCLSSGTKTVPKFYECNIENKSSKMCLEFCPFREAYFLVGAGDGSIHIYSRQSSHSLMTFYNSPVDNSDSKTHGNTMGIKLLQWSRSRPCQFFTVDFNNVLHIWDLQSSDIYPIISIPFEKCNLIDMKLLPKQKNNEYLMVLAFDDGAIQVHQLASDFITNSLQQTNDEQKKLLFYLDIV